MNLEHISLIFIENWREKEKLNADLEAEEGKLLENNLFINYIMSGGVPKRVQISRIQRNTPSKAGNVVAKKALVLCSGRRSRRAMCNYIKQRAKTCAKCPPSVSPCTTCNGVENLSHIAIDKVAEYCDLQVYWTNVTPCQEVVMIEVELEDFVTGHTRYVDFKHPSKNLTIFKKVYYKEEDPYTGILMQSTYKVVVTTHCLQGKSIVSSPSFTIVPTTPPPPPSTCANLTPTQCASSKTFPAEKWFGTITSVKKTAIGKLFGVSITFSRVQPVYTHCITKWTWELLELGTSSPPPPLASGTFQNLSPHPGLESFFICNNCSDTGSSLTCYQVPSLKPNTDYTFKITAHIIGNCGPTTTYQQTVTTGEEYIPINPVGPTPLPPSEMPQLFMTHYGIPSFLRSKFQLTGYIQGVSTAVEEAIQIQSWSDIRTFMSSYFQSYISFIKKRNIKRAYVNIGDWSTVMQKNTTGPSYPENKPNTAASPHCAPNGPVDYGLPYNSHGGNLGGKYTDNDGTGKTTNQIGCSLILDFLIPLEDVKVEDASGNSVPVEVGVIAPIQGKYPSYSWDVGNYGDKTDANNNNDPRWTIPNCKAGAICLYSPQTAVPDWWNTSGNVFIGNGAVQNSPTSDAPAGTGRTSHWTTVGLTKPSTDNPTFVPADGHKGTYVVAGIPLADKQYPMDNAHQLYKTVYEINKKVMILNNTGRTIPLITHINHDHESGSPYLSPGTYPSTDSTGELIAPSLGTPVNMAYLKYLYNRYMPAECLPKWRTNHTGQPKNMTLNSGGVADRLWNHVQNPGLPSNQMRNFGDEAGTAGGYKNTSNDFSVYSSTVPGSYDGIQRYNWGYIFTTVPGFDSNGGEGLIVPMQELYNIGEVKPAIVNLPAADSNTVIAGGSGCITAPPPTFSGPNNCVVNSIFHRIYNKYKRNFMGKNSVDTTKKSPAITDLWLRNGAGGVALDGRGLKSDGTLKLTNFNDGFYCPIEEPFVHETTGKIDLKPLYGSAGSLNDGIKLNDLNKDGHMGGPNGAMAVFSCEIFSASCVQDPKNLGPDYLAPCTEPMKGGTSCKEVASNPSNAHKRTCISVQQYAKMIKKGITNYTASNWPGQTCTCASSPGQENCVKCLRDYGWPGKILSAYGGEADLLSAIYSWVDVQYFFNTVGKLMCGETNYTKAQIGIYSWQYIPLSWQDDPNTH